MGSHQRPGQNQGADTGVSFFEQKKTHTNHPTPDCCRRRICSLCSGGARRPLHGIQHLSGGDHKFASGKEVLIGSNRSKQTTQLNKRKQASKQASKQAINTNKQTNKQRNNQASKQSSKQKNKTKQQPTNQPNKQTNKPTNKQTNKQTNKAHEQTNKQTNKETNTAKGQVTKQTKKQINTQTNNQSVHQPISRAKKSFQSIRPSIHIQQSIKSIYEINSNQSTNQSNK